MLLPLSYRKALNYLLSHTLLSGLVSVPGSLAENLAIKGTATQSSTYDTWTAQRSIDGVRNGGEPEIVPYCSHTSSESNPWWRLDLQDYYDISTVIISARPDCCLDQTSGAEIRIGDSLENNGNNNPICAVTAEPLLDETTSFSCHGMKGRYVNVVRSGRTTNLVLCEVEVYGVLPYRQKTFLRLKFSSSGDVAAESDKILHQLQSALGLNISDFKLSWTQLPKKEEEQEEDGVCQMCAALLHLQLLLTVF
ncbi:fucolectin-1-like [Triplophysa dalaica]|uniref:fucolectin-1-like n=1 Tax=Triplophysa dalaica TaxID=1582913 RepID=UPI0024DFDDD7|nr:fucolectin-1-like [Triplophysa dalaica]